MNKAELLKSLIRIQAIDPGFEVFPLEVTGRLMLCVADGASAPVWLEGLGLVLIEDQNVWALPLEPV